MSSKRLQPQGPIFSPGEAPVRILYYMLARQYVRGTTGLLFGDKSGRSRQLIERLSARRVVTCKDLLVVDNAGKARRASPEQHGCFSAIRHNF